MTCCLQWREGKNKKKGQLLLLQSMPEELQSMPEEQMSGEDFSSEGGKVVRRKEVGDDESASFPVVACAGAEEKFR